MRENYERHVTKGGVESDKCESFKSRRNSNLNIYVLVFWMLLCQCCCTTANHPPRVETARGIPSPQHPFVYLHNPKSGGSTFRKYLHDTSHILQLESFIPGYGDTSYIDHALLPSFIATRHSLEQLPISFENVSVFGGIFDWSLMDMLEGAQRQPTCYTHARHPVDRTISWYYRFGYKKYSKLFSELSVDELDIFMTETYVGVRPLSEVDPVFVNESSYFIHLDIFANANCRQLAGEVEVVGQVVSQNNSPLLGQWRVGKRTLQKAKTNSNRCLIGMFEEREASNAAVKHWLPWVHNASTLDVHEYGGGVRYSNKETRFTAPSHLTLRIEELSYCDMELYSFQVEQFLRQKSTK